MMEDVDIWFQDESRVGQQGSQTRVWAPKGTRPRVVKQQQFLYQYIYGAVCPAQGLGAAIIAPFANHKCLELHLQEIGHHVPEGRHAIVIMDSAGWHKAKDLQVPKNITLLNLPPYAPELNPQECVWKYIKDHELANRVYASVEEIMQACCTAWENFVKNPNLITSIASRPWLSFNDTYF